MRNLSLFTRNGNPSTPSSGGLEFQPRLELSMKFQSQLYKEMIGEAHIHWSNSTEKFQRLPDLDVFHILWTLPLNLS